MWRWVIEYVTSLLMKLLLIGWACIHRGAVSWHSRHCITLLSSKYLFGLLVLDWEGRFPFTRLLEWRLESVQSVAWFAGPIFFLRWGFPLSYWFLFLSWVPANGISGTSRYKCSAFIGGNGKSLVKDYCVCFRITVFWEAQKNIKSRAIKVKFLCLNKSKSNY